MPLFDCARQGKVKKINRINYSMIRYLSLESKALATKRTRQEDKLPSRVLKDQGWFILSVV